jgi:dienelactone hydrolase
MKTLIAAVLLSASVAFAAPACATSTTTTSTSQKPAPVAAANALLDDMDAGRFDAVHARFAPTMAAAVSADKLKTIWASLPQQFGKFEHRGTARVETANGMTIVNIPLAFEHFALEASVATDASGKVAGFLIRPAPPPPAATRSDLPTREVQFGPAHRTALPGTLSFPNSKGSDSNKVFPAVVLVHGSGPNDRNETVGGTRVFLDVAEGFADRGIASLRYEKRTKVHPEEYAGAYTVDDETTDDAVAAVAFLKSQSGIDPKRIYIVGHSQGAMMAPRIAQYATGLRGMVLMAAPARHLEDIVYDQFTYLAKADGTIDANETAQLAQIKVMGNQIKTFGADVPATTKMLNDLPASYWRNLRDYDPVALAKTQAMPMLIVQGDRDFQVTAPDWKLWQSAFASNKRATIHHYPTMNHLFVAGSGPGAMAEYATPGHVDAHVIDDIAAWIHAH